MKILITGGNGYLARNLKPLFEQNGYEVIAPSRTELDLLNLEYLSTYLKFERFDAVIHLAARGGRRTKEDTFEEVYVPNIQMFENLVESNTWEHPIPIITVGSGAEFDRRYAIDNAREDTIFDRWPIDPYGLSKNIIARRALSDFSNVWVLRLFGCFNWDDDPSRFVRAAIENLKRGQGIKVHCHKMMDYFYMDDVFIVMDHILKHGGPRNVNLVYREKVSLLSLAEIICSKVQMDNKVIEILNPHTDKPYTGDAYFLHRMGLIDDNLKLIGLEEGIRRTVHKLL